MISMWSENIHNYEYLLLNVNLMLRMMMILGFKIHNPIIIKSFRPRSYYEGF